MEGEGRVLKFIVKNQKIIKDKECDFTGLVAGSQGMLKAQIEFSREWEGMNKIVVFTMLGQIKMEKLDKYGVCIIPSDVLKYNKFYVSVVGEIKGKDGNRRRLRTDSVKVNQKVV